MFPKIGPLKLYTVIYILSMFAHVWAAQVWCRRLALTRRSGLWLSAFFFFGMAVGARILYDVLQHRLHLSNYLRPGYYFEDGLWGGPLAYLLIAIPFILIRGTRWRDHLDLMVLALPLPMVLAKFACLLNGCCFGEPCDWPWCISFHPGAEAPADIPRHPTQAYEIIVLVFAWFVLVRLDRRRWAGLLTLWFGVIYGLGRPMTEIFRVVDVRRPSAGILTTSQLVCLAGAGLAALALLILRPPRRRLDVPLSRPLGF